MKQYLIDTFRFNDWANKKMLAAMSPMLDKTDVTAIFSHLITAQNRWLLRVNNDPAEAKIKWWDTPFLFEELGALWDDSLKAWLEFFAVIDDGDLDKPVTYTPGTDDNGGSQALRDIVLQLNYHSILHRAEIGLRLRDRGVEPPHTDYIYYLPPQNLK
ncbi:MAG: DinB family protein [Blastocatellia bacterium]